MTYTLMKAAHLLAVMVWMGGMFFALYCLRPAVAVLDGAPRVRLMHDALGRFFRVVTTAVVAIVLSSAWMIFSQFSTARRASLAFNMPLDWWAMALLGGLMIGIFGYIRGVLFKRLQQAVQAQDWPTAGDSLGRIRRWVSMNLAIGVLIVIVTRLGQMA